MLTGSDIRRYRKSIGLSQIEFARRMGVSQSGLSQLESGRIAVSDEHFDRLKNRFADQDDKTPFRAFLKKQAAMRDVSQRALTMPIGKYLTLTVWRWEEGYDLGQVPQPDQVADLVTIRATSNATIAFQMPQESDHWVRGEILVFEECRPTDVVHKDVCLLQLKPPRARALKTVVAVARRGSPAQLVPIKSKGPILAADDDAVRVLMRATFRCRRF